MSEVPDAYVVEKAVALRHRARLFVESVFVFLASFDSMHRLAHGLASRTITTAIRSHSQGCFAVAHVGLNARR